MASFKDGLFGKASGSVSNLIISSRNGKAYVRAKPEKVHNPRTPAQQATRQRLSLLSGMLRRFKAYIKAGFPNPPLGKSSRDIAYRANYSRVFTGVYPDIRLDYSQALLSSGKRGTAVLQEPKLEGAELHLKWDVQGDGRNSANSDNLRLLVFNEARDEVFMQFRAAKRGDNQLIVTLPDVLLPSAPDTQLQLWISFASIDGKQVSDSIYARIQG